ncbi:hypothetical protein SAMN04487969_11937 [Paenibacillus algorifonticola]|uniref:Uncharacterized protein n=1 Tax=Paenibacillus algorifonticola TaxID=684063 RepID=A0A1I2GY53_9BACL|nr:hypothetical protein [Paenibacillus algorifonticola]SFF22685.1 hypothetical protein SAMN04487969_11937 [Paenibacillus algorifonticola]
MGKYDDKRRQFQQLKSLSNDKFWEAMNVLHTRAYAAAQRHYSEAMDIELTPRQKQAVEAKATEIRELWDGMETVDTDATGAEVFKPAPIKEG